jgi:hypothetical protein
MTRIDARRGATLFGFAANLLFACGSGGHAREPVPEVSISPTKAASSASRPAPSSASASVSATASATAGPGVASAPHVRSCEHATDQAVYLEITSKESPSDRVRLDRRLDAARRGLIAYCKGQADPDALIDCVDRANDHHQMRACYGGTFPPP